MNRTIAKMGVDLFTQNKNLSMVEKVNSVAISGIAHTIVPVVLGSGNPTEAIWKGGVTAASAAIVKVLVGPFLPDVFEAALVGILAYEAREIVVQSLAVAPFSLNKIVFRGAVGSVNGLGYHVMSVITSTLALDVMASFGALFVGSAIIEGIIEPLLVSTALLKLPIFDVTAAAIKAAPTLPVVKTVGLGVGIASILTTTAVTLKVIETYFGSQIWESVEIKPIGDYKELDEL